MTYKLFTVREIPEDARRFIALDDEGLPYQGVEIDGVRYDAEFWRVHDGSPMPYHHKERPE